MFFFFQLPFFCRLPFHCFCCRSLGAFNCTHIQLHAHFFDRRPGRAARFFLARVRVRWPNMYRNEIRLIRHFCTSIVSFRSASGARTARKRNERKKMEEERRCLVNNKERMSAAFLVDHRKYPCSGVYFRRMSFVFEQVALDKHWPLAVNVVFSSN